MSDELTLLVVIGDAAATPDPLNADAKIDPLIRGELAIGVMVPDGGTPPYTYAVTGGTIPPGTTLDTSTGQLTGTPTTQGTYEFEVTVTDAVAASFASLFSLTVAGGVIFSNPEIPVAADGVAYFTQFTMSGGVPPYTLSVVGGSPPGSLTLSGANVGDYTIASPSAPVTTARSTFTLRATDSAGNYGERMFVLYILPPLQFTGGLSDAALMGLAYYHRIGYRYGIVQPYPKIQPSPQFSITSGALPDGLLLSPTTGVISGLPVASGPFSFDVQMSDSLGASDTLSGQIYVHEVSDIDKIWRQSFGDGGSTVFVITHDLEIPDYVPRSVFVYDQGVGLPMPTVDVEWEVVDQNNIQITTYKVPAVGQYYVVVTG